MVLLAWQHRLCISAADIDCDKKDRHNKSNNDESGCSALGFHGFLSLPTHNGFSLVMAVLIPVKRLHLSDRLTARVARCCVVQAGLLCPAVAGVLGATDTTTLVTCCVIFHDPDKSLCFQGFPNDLHHGITCAYNVCMETNRTYTAIRMANGKTTHIASTTSSTTLCGRWTGNTRQYPTDEKEIGCSQCIQQLSYYAEAIDQGFYKKGSN